MGKELLKVELENGIIEVNVDDIPEIVTSSIDNISKLEDQVRKAETSASKAMDYVSGQMTRYEVKGKWIFKHRSGNTKDIIEDTQEAVEKLADGLQVSVEALNKSFEFQKKLAETSKYLFYLGCANITVNRIAVRAIELKLSGASKAKISDLARQEMMAVVKQLKGQEDIFKKQEFLSYKVKEHATRLDGKDSLDEEQTVKIESLASENTNQDKKISEIFGVLSDKDRIDAEQAQRLEDHSRLLGNKDIVDEKQEQAIATNSALIEKNTEDIRTLRKYCIIAMIVSSVSLVISAASILLRFLM